MKDLFVFSVDNDYLFAFFNYYGKLIYVCIEFMGLVNDGLFLVNF
jgi:hypothetical protein